MERIVLNVDDASGLAYKNFSEEYKKQFNTAVNLLLKKIANSNSISNYKQMLDDMGKEAEANGLNQDVLDELLAQHD
jgi:hypothetical protein